MHCQVRAGSGFTAPIGKQPRGAFTFSSPGAGCWPAFFRRTLHTKIINETDKTIVLRAKYRDIWEGEPVKLERKNGVMVEWTPEVYRRLGAFVEEEAGQAAGRPVYIGNEDMGENEEISITEFSSKDCLQLKMIAKLRRERAMD